MYLVSPTVMRPSSAGMVRAERRWTGVIRIQKLAESLDVDGAVAVAMKGLQPKHAQPANEDSL